MVRYLAQIYTPGSTHAYAHANWHACIRSGLTVLRQTCNRCAAEINRHAADMPQMCNKHVRGLKDSSNKHSALQHARNMRATCIASTCVDCHQETADEASDKAAEAAADSSADADAQAAAQATS